jgi:hypothetical protein
VLGIVVIVELAVLAVRPIDLAGFNHEVALVVMTLVAIDVLASWGFHRAGQSRTPTATLSVGRSR